MKVVVLRKEVVGLLDLTSNLICKEAPNLNRIWDWLTARRRGPLRTSFTN